MEKASIERVVGNTAMVVRVRKCRHLFFGETVKKMKVEKSGPTRPVVHKHIKHGVQTDKRSYYSISVPFLLSTLTPFQPTIYRPSGLANQSVQISLLGSSQNKKRKED
jgi:hypothetical protein